MTAAKESFAQRQFFTFRAAKVHTFSLTAKYFTFFFLSRQYLCNL